MRKLFLRIVLLGLALWRPAAAQTCTDFAQAGTVAPSYGTGCYQLTALGATNSVGAVWSPQAISLNSDFDISFGVTQCGGADGVVFVLHNDGPSPVISRSGENLSYYGRANVFAHSVGIELDIYQNDYAPYFDPPYPHMMLAVNGNAAPVRGPVAMPKLTDCSQHILRIRWSQAAHLLTTQLDGSTVFTYSEDLVNTIFGGNATVWYGFVGSTGGVTATQTVCPQTQATTPVPAPVIAVTEGKTTLCAGESVLLTTPAYGAGTTYQWSPAVGLNSANTTGVIAKPLATTTYRVRITSPNGCQRTDSIRLAVVPRPAATVSARQLVCAGSSARLQALSPVAGATHTWAPTQGLSASTGETVVATPAATTLYTVTTTTPGAACARQDTVRVVVLPAPRVAVAVQRPTTFGGSTQLTAASPVAGTTYAWAPAQGLSATTGALVTATPPVPTTYTVTATTPGGCTGQASVVAQPFLLPNIITPNGDHLNDTFQPQVSPDAITLQVFTRWGQLVFEQANYHNDWGADNLADGLYYYRLTTTQGESWKGWLEVLR